jgi:signal transduction histidine kinase
VQAEVLLSLALVMVTGTGLLAAVFLEINHAGLDRLHPLLGRGLLAQSREAAFERGPGDIGSWWRIDPEGRVTGLNASSERLDALTRELAAEVARSGEPMVQSGAPWVPIRFAAPRVQGPGVIAGRIEAPVSGVVLLVLFAANVLIFGLFGVTLLRRRVVGPLHRLATGVREIGEGELPATLPVEGVGEIEELGTAFNEMQEALAARTGALEKAVVELRRANANLLQAREGLDRAERLAMVGSLAAGVAHEVGNPMGALLAFLEVAGRDDGISEQARRCLSRASEQGERVRVILRQLLDFSRLPQIEHGPIELEEIAQQVVELIAAQERYADIEFHVEAEEDVAPAIGDASLASQILLNLAINAASAIEGREDRRVSLHIANEVRRRRSGDRAASPDPAGRADTVVCYVGDSGPGVPVDHASRIFDPFYTTKDPGEGTGLGLANARRLAEEMGGSVDLAEVASNLGGALFSFRLPVDVGDSPESIENSAVSVRPVDSQSRIS